MGDMFGGGGQSSVTVDTPNPPTQPVQPFEPPPPPDIGSFEPPATDPYPPEFRDYITKAMNKQLPVSQATEQDIATKRGQLIQALVRTEGKDYATSTTGIQALTAFDQKAEAIRDAERGGNTALSQTLLQGLFQQQQLGQRAALEAFQASTQAALEQYQADLEGRLAAYKAQYAQPTGTTRTTTTKGGGGGAGSLLGGVAGIGAASVLGAKQAPWWMPQPADAAADPNAEQRGNLGFTDQTYPYPLDTAGPGARGGGGSVGDFAFTPLPPAPDYSQWLDPGAAAPDFSGMLDTSGMFGGGGGGFNFNPSSFNLSDYSPYNFDLPAFQLPQFSFDMPTFDFSNLGLGDMGGGGVFSDFNFPVGAAPY